MATVAAVATVIGAVAAVGGAIVSNRRQKKIAKEQERQNKIQNKLARARQAREIRRRIAQARVQRAETEQAGFQFGVAGSSSAVQAAGAQTTDVAGTVGFANQQAAGATLVAQSQNRISNIQSQLNPFSVIQAGAGAFSNPQTNSAIADLF